MFPPSWQSARTAPHGLAPILAERAHASRPVRRRASHGAGCGQGGGPGRRALQGGGYLLAPGPGVGALCVHWSREAAGSGAGSALRRHRKGPAAAARHCRGRLRGARAAAGQRRGAAVGLRRPSHRERAPPLDRGGRPLLRVPLQVPPAHQDEGRAHIRRHLAAAAPRPQVTRRPRGAHRHPGRRAVRGGHRADPHAAFQAVPRPRASPPHPRAAGRALPLCRWGGRRRRSGGCT